MPHPLDAERSPAASRPRPSPGSRPRPTPHPRSSEEELPAPPPGVQPEPLPAAEPAVLAEAAPSPDGVDVWALVRQAQEGDAEAFGRLYDHFVTMVYRYVYHRVGDRATAEDVTSETFVRALRRIDSLSFQGRDVGAWLVTIARNIVLDHVKSSRYRLEVATADMRDADRPPTARRTPSSRTSRTGSCWPACSSSAASSRSASCCASSTVSPCRRRPRSWARRTARSRRCSTGRCAGWPAWCRKVSDDRKENRRGRNRIP